MEQLVFVAVVLLFTILDGIAKKKRKQAQMEAAVMDESGEPSPDAASPRGSGPSAWTEPGPGVEPWADPEEAGGPDAGPTQGAGIPRDVWEEIAALAAGRPVPSPVDPPVPQERLPAPLPVRPAHRVHLSHEAYGKPMEERLTPLDRPSMHQAPGLSGEVRRARGLLAEGGGSLRQAVILKELLGPPVSLREDR